MVLRLMGAFLIIIGCGGVGFSMAMNYRKQEKCIRDLLKAIDIFACELEYKLSPLPNICRSVSDTVGGCVGRIFSLLAEKLDEQVCPDAACCMKAALQEERNIPHSCQKYISELGQTLGRFDVTGQLTELSATKKDCEEALETIRAERDVRTRNYQTLGLCAGAALAILLI